MALRRSYIRCIASRNQNMFIALLASWLLVGQDSASQQSALFPKELTSFDPEGEIVFQARPGEWDSFIRERGWIMKSGDQYRMYYTGYRDKESTRLLGTATSIDGKSWIRDPGNPLVKDLWVEDMMVVKQGGVLQMFAEGKDDVAHRLTSKDGLHWNAEGPLDIRLKNGEPISPGPRGTPTAWFEDGLWRLLYERGDRGIWLATSRDLKVWTNVQDDPVLNRGPEPFDKHMIALNQVIKYKGRYYAIYHGLENPDTKRWTTNLATTTDFVHWTKYPGNPLVPGNRSSGILVETADGWTLYTMHDIVRRHRPIK
jgi:beta-1,2-mannobiose phosphorylase / 1,2-beta-oligomannan phosphorylase